MSQRRVDRTARRKAEARARREATRGRAGSRRGLALLAGGAVLVAVVSTAVARNDGDGAAAAKPRPLYTAAAREGSEPVRGDSTVLGFGAPPESYDVTYDVEDHAAGRTVRSIQRVRVRRPFESRVETRPLSGARTPSVQISGFGRIHFLGGNGADASSVVVAPFTAGGDLRPDVVADELIERKMLQRRELRTVAGRRCQVFRSMKSLGQAEPAVLTRNPTDYVDSCLDRQGLLLEQVTVDARRILRRQVATTVKVGPRLSDGLFPLGKPLEFGGGLGSVLEVRTTSGAIGPFYELPSPPAGFGDHRRYAVVPPQPQVEQIDPELTRNARIAGTFDVWRRGPDVLMIDQSGTIGRTQSLDIPDHAVGVDIPAVPGEAGVILDPRMVELRILLPRGRFVRVMGTLPSEDLVEVAKSLVLTEGKGLDYLEPPPGATSTTTSSAP